MEYTIDRSLEPPSCLPSDLVDDTNLKDITCVGDAWRSYLDMTTNLTHDGAKYYAKTLEVK